VISFGNLIDTARFMNTSDLCYTKQYIPFLSSPQARRTTTDYDPTSTHRQTSF